MIYSNRRCDESLEVEAGGPSGIRQRGNTSMVATATTVKTNLDNTLGHSPLGDRFSDPNGTV